MKRQNMIVVIMLLAILVLVGVSQIVGVSTSEPPRALAATIGPSYFEDITARNITATAVSANSFTGNSATINGSVSVTGTVQAGGVQATSASFSSLQVAGTPVAFTTPAIFYEMANGTLIPSAVICSQQVITGSAVITLPFSPVATPVITHNFAALPAYDHSLLSHTVNATGTVTIYVWQAITAAGTTTPQAATTSVAVDWCARGVR
jgi:hypothetical protein